MIFSIYVIVDVPQEELEAELEDLLQEELEEQLLDIGPAATGDLLEEPVKQSKNSQHRSDLYVGQSQKC